MPYDKISELPDLVTENLPKRAQGIFLAAYTNAWDEYADPKRRRGDADREETSMKVAWSAVKQSYEKEGDRWVKKD